MSFKWPFKGRKPTCQHKWKYRGTHIYGMHREPKKAAPFFFVCEICGASELRTGKDGYNARNLV